MVVLLLIPWFAYSVDVGAQLSAGDNTSKGSRAIRSMQVSAL